MVPTSWPLHFQGAACPHGFTFTGWSVPHSFVLWVCQVTPKERSRAVLSSILSAKVKETDRQAGSRWRDARRHLEFRFLWAKWGVCGFEEKYPRRIGFLASWCKTTFRKCRPWPQGDSRHNSCSVISPKRAKLWVTCSKIKMIFCSRFYSTSNQWTSASSY